MNTSAAQRGRAADDLSAGEFSYTRKDFEQIARMLYDETGIHLPAGKATLVYSRMAKRLRALQIENFREYCELVSSNEEERAAMVAALTTNVTRFFRENHHFEHFREKVLKPRLPELRARKRLRVWSAGCSSGQEPYSLALTILSVLPDARSFDIRILATDINPHVLETGRRGYYSAEELADVPAELRNTWMERAEGGYLLDDAVRGLVSFRELNLMGGWPMKGPFDVIFCRNVVIYFDEPTQNRIWNRMLPLLAPGGMLYIGHSERVIGPALRQLNLEATTSYRKAEKP